MKKQQIITGLHIIGNINSRSPLLTQMNQVKLAISNTIKKYKLHELGSYYHEFDSGGFTGVISLSESHICIHTWPELDYVTLDVYICDYSKKNNQICEEVFKDIVSLFEPIEIRKQSIQR